MVGMLEQGSTAAEVVDMVQADLLGDDPLAAWERSVDEQAAAFRVDGALEQVWHHAAFDMAGSMVMGFRLADPALHAWDLARAIGADDQLDPELMEQVPRFVTELAASDLIDVTDTPMMHTVAARASNIPGAVMISSQNCAGTPTRAAAT